MQKLISWVEIPAADFDRAAKFYASVFNLDLQIVEGGGEKMACFPSGEGAISFAPGFHPSKDGVLVSLNAGNQLEATLARVEKEGGQIIRPKTKIDAEGRGYFALFLDSEGNKVGLYGEE